MGLRFGVALVLAALGAGCSGGSEETASPTTESRPAPVTTRTVVTPASAKVVVKLDDWGPVGGTRGTVTLRDVPTGVELVLALDADVELYTLGPLRFWDDDCDWTYNNSLVGGASPVPNLILKPKGRHWRTTIPYARIDELGAASIGFDRMLFLCGDV